MAFGKRSPSVAATAESPASPAAEKVAALTDRRGSLARRRDAAGLEAEELRRNLDAAAAAGEETSQLAEALVATEGRSRAISLELAAVGKALAAAAAVVAAEEAAAERARLERAHAKAEVAFEDAERRFREALAALSTSIGPMFKAEKERDRAASAAGRPTPPFHPDRADEELAAELRATDPAGTELLKLEVPWLPSPRT